MSDEPWRAELLLAYLGRPGDESIDSSAEVEAALAELLGQAEQAWPAIALPQERFIRHLAELVADQPTDVPLAAQLRALRAGDLYLACACADQLPAALRELEREVVDRIGPAVRRLGATPAAVDEIRAELLAALLSPRAGGPPAIAGYAGRGRLYSWVRSIAVRIAMRRLGGAREIPTEAAELADRMPHHGEDPRLDDLRRRYRHDFAVAFRAALAALPVRERNLLRQHHMDGLTIDQLAALYRVHRATAARWVARARATLSGETRRRLMERLGVATQDADSIIRLVRSQLDLSLSAAPGDAEPG